MRIGRWHVTTCCLMRLETTELSSRGREEGSGRSWRSCVSTVNARGCDRAPPPHRMATISRDDADTSMLPPMTPSRYAPALDRYIGPILLRPVRKVKPPHVGSRRESAQLRRNGIAYRRGIYRLRAFGYRLGLLLSQPSHDGHDRGPQRERHQHRAPPAHRP